MRQILKQAKRALAVALRRAADRLEPPAPAAISAAAPAEDSETARANAMVVEIVAARARVAAGIYLGRALRKYSSPEQTAEA